MLRLTTLGAVDLRDRRGHAVRDVLTQPKRVALLVYLAVEGRRAPVSRDRLLALFWPESDATRARNALSQSLHHLRQALGPDVVESQGAGAVALRTDALWCDAVVCAEALDRGDVELALDLYRGEFCPTLFVSGAPEAEEWLEGQRRRLRSAALAAARAHAERLAERGEAEAAVRAARRAFALHPEDESDVRALLALLDRCGDGAGALLAYRDFAQRMAASLEMAPAAETRRLVEAIRRGREPRPEAAPDRAVPGAATAAALPGAPLVERAAGPRHRRLLVGVAAILALAIGIAFVVGLVERRHAPGPIRGIAVFPFAVRGGAGGDLGYLSEGMTDLLSAKLDGAVGLHAIDPRSVVAATAGREGSRPLSVAECARIARSLGAGWFIGGDVVEVAGRLQLNGELYDARGGAAPVAAASVVGQASGLFGLVDDLAGRILAGLTAGRDTALTRVASITTHSLPALKAFLQGEQALRAGLDAQAGAAFLEAATLDSGFALAQYRLALTLTWVDVPTGQDPTAWAATAARHAQRLPLLARDLLEAYRAYRELKADTAERMYRGIVSGHPDNVEAWLMLGETLFHDNMWRGRAPSESRAAFERVLALDPANAHAMVHLARLAALEGRPAELDSLARRYLSAHRGAERAIEIRALQAFVHHDSAGRAEVAAAAFRSGDYVLLTGLIQAASSYAQDLEAAEELVGPFRRLPANPLMERFARRIISDFPLAGGRWGIGQATRLLGTAVDADWLTEAQALVAADPFFPVPRSRVAALRDSIAARAAYPTLSPYVVPGPDIGAEMRAYLLGLLSVRLGDRAAAERHLETLEALERSAGVSPARDLAHGLRAEMARTAGDLRGALAELEAFTFQPPTAGHRSVAHWGNHERFLTAELLHALGRDREALPWYESLMSAYDLPWLAPSHVRMGEIHERLGDRERAVFHYRRALALWSGADPEFRPLVARATAGLARLAGPG